MLARFRRKAAKPATEKDVEGGSSSSEVTPTTPTTKRARVKRHCARFWWIYLIVVIVVVLVIVLSIVYVLYPREIRKFAHDPKYNVESIAIINPRPDGITINSTASVPAAGSASLDAKVAAFNVTATPKGSTTALWTVQIPPLSINSKTIHVTTNVSLPDPKPMQDFTNTILSGGNLSVDLAGNMSIKYGALPTVHAPLTSDYTLAGVSSLSQLSLDNLRGFDLELAPLPDGAIVVANLSINNPSVLSVDMGNVTFDMAVAGQKAATLLFPNFFFKQGMHNYTIHLLAQFVPFENLIKRNCGKLSITINNGSSMYDGTDIPYYTYALQKINTTSMLDLSKTIDPTLLGVILPDKCKNQTKSS